MIEEKEWFEGRNTEDTDSTILPLPFWILLILAAFALGGCSTAGVQERQPDVVIPVHVVEQDGMKLRMLPTPCEDARSKVMAAQMSPLEYHDKWKATSSDWRMRDGSWQTFAGCWLEVDKDVLSTPDNVFFFTFSDGQSGNALKGELLKPKGGGA